MKFVIRHFKIILSILIVCIILLLTGCSALSLNKEELLDRIPEMNPSAFNRFLFTIKIVAGNTDGDSEEFTMSGAVETYGNISHMYNLDIFFAKSGYKTKAESWADFDSDERYEDLGEGWIIGEIKNNGVINDLVKVVNDKNAEMILTVNDSVCTLSWTFPTDDNYLFGAILEQFTDNMDLNGYGRITAVFDPQTYEFQYFTFVISTSNEEHAVALLDAIFYWEVINSDTDMLEIPFRISSTVQKEM